MRFDTQSITARLLANPTPITTVALQFPEGLVDHAFQVANQLEEQIPGLTCVIFSDVVYGACNIDDINCRLLGVDAIVHFGHSEIVEVSSPILSIYVPVTLEGDVEKTIDALTRLAAEKGHRNLALVTTAQFVEFLSNIERELQRRSPPFRIFGVPQAKLRKFEILGCTCARFPTDVDAIVSVVDGDFHLEAACLSNARLPMYRLLPQAGSFEAVSYDAAGRIARRQEAIQCALEHLRDGKMVGIVFGTLGRQGSLSLLNVLLKKLRTHKIRHRIISLHEVLPQYLFPHKDVSFFGQLACPRLTLDWDDEFKSAGLFLLNYFELVKAIDLYAGVLARFDDIEDYRLVNFCNGTHGELTYYSS
ncbi:Diphthamide biosynthesis protein 1 [Giardia muris]|uniref:2-(3-amino-3-carboxypropyl)histidine synthase subunit 1 n=1 Tax=Giardia muris TaxID=5742 RepID=A0A4Z1T4Q2_GIAMU|nr:Diphthamide biosynthesis protein 1 [Giardia muris]|eukprot:TNJ28973.1 Diphthamide biosynthesis protein 1 [Giardia muris]